MQHHVPMPTIPRPATKTVLRCSGGTTSAVMAVSDALQQLRGEDKRFVADSAVEDTFGRVMVHLL